MAEHNEVYRRAQYYDIVFNRDVSREADFVAALYRRHAGGELRSVLDIACGPGYHAREFARRGLRAVGLDLREEMIAFARDQAAERGERVTWLVGDMREFTLEEPVDAAFTLFDSMDCLPTNTDIVRHLRSVASNLTPGGIYLIDLTHPREVSMFTYADFHYRYTGEREGIRVEIDWAVNKPVFDPLTQLAQVEVEMRVHRDGSTEVLRDRAQERFISAQEIDALAALSGRFNLCAWHGDFDLAQPLDLSPASRRMIAVLQKNA